MSVNFKGRLVGVFSKFLFAFGRLVGVFKISLKTTGLFFKGFFDGERSKVAEVLTGSDTLVFVEVAKTSGIFSIFEAERRSSVKDWVVLKLSQYNPVLSFLGLSEPEVDPHEFMAG